MARITSLASPGGSDNARATDMPPRNPLEDWGLIFTSLDIEEKISGTSVDVSRTEINYSWRF